MAVKILINEKNQRLNHPAVTINPKLRRLTLNQQAFSMLVKENGTESHYAQILYDDTQAEVIFWIKLCDAKSLGGRKLDSCSKSTRTCNIASLMQVLNWTTTETARFEMTYDKQLKAGKVDPRKPLRTEGSQDDEKK